MILYFLRHGKAEKRGEWTGPDEQRPLTKNGVELMKQQAATMEKLELNLDLIVTSPLARARGTAEIVARALGMSKKLLEDPALSPGFSPAKLQEVLDRHPRASAIMLVGHEPDFSDTISALTGGGRVVCRKGCLARIDFADRSLVKKKEGELAWLLQPEVMS
jgi:phosphohistidine phosphatase